MISHVSIGVRDLAVAIAFYDAALAPLGLVRCWTQADGAGYGRPGEDEGFALKHRPDAAAPGPGFHLCFEAPDRAAVDAFHAAALKAGARDNGAPGLRPNYAPDYYAAFVIDPEGWALEALFNQAV